MEFIEEIYRVVGNKDFEQFRALIDEAFIQNEEG
jgi:hypothetical protein